MAATPVEAIPARDLAAIVAGQTDPHETWKGTCYEDRLGPQRSCRWCGATVRQAMLHGRNCLRYETYVEGPVPYSEVDIDWPAWFWHDKFGLIDRERVSTYRWEPACALYVMHPCERTEYRPAPTPLVTAPPSTERAPAQMTAPQFETFTAPVMEDGDKYSPAEHIGAVLIVKVRERKEGVITPNSPNGGPAVIVDCVDLADGNAYRNVLWMGGAFVDAMTPYLGKGPVVIQVVSKVGKSGRAYSAPDAANAEQIALAGSYYAAKGDPFAQVFATVAAEAAPAASFPPAAAPAQAPPVAAAATSAPPWA